MIKILWLCNGVLPQAAKECNEKATVLGGWMTGLADRLLDLDYIELNALAVANKMGGCLEHHKAENLNQWIAPRFLFNEKKYSKKQEQIFIDAIQKIKPDIVHIWGTEHQYSLCMVNACRKEKLLGKTAISIQGLTSIYSKHYMACMPADSWKYNTFKDVIKKKTFTQQIADFETRGKYEELAIKQVEHVVGRTDWDEACSYFINPKAKYYFNEEILRKSFYENAGTWNVHKCKKYTIFLSQAQYPIKGLHMVIEAARYLLPHYPDLEIWVSGADLTFKKGIRQGGYGKYIQMLIRKYNLAGKIKYLGILDEKQMIEKYKEANVFVSPSSIENESNSLSEAKMVGTPCVVSYVGGVTGRIEHGVDGFLYPFDEPYMLAFYIRKLFESDELCASLSSLATRQARITNDRNKNVQQLMEIYKNIISNNQLEE